MFKSVQYINVLRPSYYSFRSVCVASCINSSRHVFTGDGKPVKANATLVTHAMKLTETENHYVASIRVNKDVAEGDEILYDYDYDLPNFEDEEKE